MIKRKKNRFNTSHNAEHENTDSPLISIFKSLVIASIILVCLSLIMIVLLLFFGGCDRRLLLLNSIKVYPYDKLQNKVSYQIKDEICFKVDLDVTKKEYSINNLNLISSAYATPPCRENEFDSPIKSLKVYTNKTVYFQTGINNTEDIIATYSFLQPVTPFTNLMEISGNNPDYFSFCRSSHDNEANSCERSDALPFYAVNGISIDASENGISLIELNHLPILFPKGNYTFWVELMLENGNTYKDSTTFNYDSSTNNFNANYSIDTSFNHSDSITTITYHSNDLNNKFDMKFSYFKNGNLAEKSFYIDEIKYGRSIKMFNNGNAKELSAYGIDGKQLKFPYVSYHPNGAIKMAVKRIQINVDRLHYKEIIVNCHNINYYNDSCVLEKIEAYSIKSNKLIKRSNFEHRELIYECYWDEDDLKREETIKLEGKYTIVKKFNYAGILRENWCTRIQNYDYIDICDRYNDEKITREIYLNGKKYAASDKINLLKVMTEKKYESLLNLRFD